MTPAQQLRAHVEALTASGWSRGRIFEELGVTRRAIERYLAQAAADDGFAMAPAARRAPGLPVVRLAARLAAENQAAA